MQGKHAPSGDGRESVDRAIAWIARQQFGVISLEQLLARGLSYSQVEERVRAGRLHRLFSGVYAVGHTLLLDYAWLFAAQLTSGPDSFLSHRTSAAVWGLRVIDRRRIEVTIPRSRVATRAGLIIHRTRHDPHPGDVSARNGLRISSVPRMLIELAGRESQNELDRLITMGIRKRHFDVTAMEEALERHARRPGLAKIKRALVHYRPKPERNSGFEDAVGPWLDAEPLIPPYVHNVWIEGIGEVDFLWLEHNFVLEIDGDDYHRTVKDLEADKWKDTKLQLRGIRTMRVTEFRWEHDRQGIRKDIYGFLGIVTPPPAPPPPRA